MNIGIIMMSAGNPMISNANDLSPYQKAAIETLWRPSVLSNEPQYPISGDGKLRTN
jgi:hypothetical protein